MAAAVSPGARSRYVPVRLPWSQGSSHGMSSRAARRAETSAGRRRPPRVPPSCVERHRALRSPRPRRRGTARRLAPARSATSRARLADGADPRRHAPRPAPAGAPVPRRARRRPAPPAPGSRPRSPAARQGAAQVRDLREHAAEPEGEVGRRLEDEIAGPQREELRAAPRSRPARRRGSRKGPKRCARSSAAGADGEAREPRRGIEVEVDRRLEVAALGERDVAAP